MYILFFAKYCFLWDYEIKYELKFVLLEIIIENKNKLYHNM